MFQSTRGHFRWSVIVVATWLCLCAPITGRPLQSRQSRLNVTVIHNNDFHTRYMPIRTSNYAECEESEQGNEECVGGAARTVAEMKHLRESEKNILFLNAGDHFQGTYWYTIKKSEVVADFVSLMQHDVMALGNHEFDDGTDELESFVDKVTTTSTNLTILSCNLVVDRRSPIYGKVHNSTVRFLEGVPIGIIGYTTPDTKFLSKPGALVTFRDEIEAIREEIQRLRGAHPTMSIFVAVGHSGFDRDKQIGAAIADLDVIVGGHSNTFLYSGTELPSREQPESEYPHVITHSTGERTLIVQAFAYGKYLGRLNVLFDELGQVEQYEGRPIYLNSTFAEDNETRLVVEQYNSALSEDVKRRIGFTSVDLVDPEACRSEECNLANVVADSFAEYFANLQTNETGSSEASGRLAILRSMTTCNTTLSVINGGNVRSSISAGNITYKAAISTLPFSNSLGLLHATGAELIELFRHSAAQFRKGGFMQVSSGLVVHYFRSTSATTDQVTLELDSLQVDCGDGWRAVNATDDTTYLVVLNSFIANGGDNYTMINATNFVDYQFNDFEVFVQYVEEREDVATWVEDRITITAKSEPGSGANQSLVAVNLLTVVALLQFVWNKQWYKTD